MVLDIMNVSLVVDPTIQYPLEKSPKERRETAATETEMRKRRTETERREEGRGRGMNTICIYDIRGRG